MDSKNMKRILVSIGITAVIALGYWLAPLVFNIFLKMHGL